MAICIGKLILVIVVIVVSCGDGSDYNCRNMEAEIVVLYSAYRSS